MWCSLAHKAFHDEPRTIGCELYPSVCMPMICTDKFSFFFVLIIITNSEHRLRDKKKKNKAKIPDFHFKR